MVKIFRIIPFLFSILFCQLQLSVPAHVFQLTVNQTYHTGEWIGTNGRKGITGQGFQIDNYGKRYYDHEFLMNGYPANPYDLFDLDTLFATSSFTVADIMRTYNSVTAPLYSLDTLPDYSKDFFHGPVSVGGSFDLFQSITTSVTMLQIVYGTSDRTNWTFQIPIISKQLDQSAAWHGNKIAGLSDWLAYHQTAKSGLESILNDPNLVNNGDGIWPLLQAVYDKFYTWTSDYSVLWALEGGDDPVKNGIFGTEYNPFGASDTSRVTMDQIFAYYYPKRVKQQGFGDLSLEFKFLAAGKPSWQNRGPGFELYTGIRMVLPLSKTISAYASDSSFPRPVSQRYEMPLGAGVTRFYPFILFSLRTQLRGHRLEFSDRISAGISSKESLNTPLIFYPTALWHPDTLMQQIGSKYYYRRGYEISQSARTSFEIKPGMVSGLVYWDLYWKGRDYFWSAAPDWDRYMAQHAGYDTQQIQSHLALAVVLFNHRPMHRFWPLLFELELGIRTSIFIRNEATFRGGWLTFTTYFQSW